MAVVLRIKFPPTYPVIHKVLRIDKELTVVEAIDFIREAVRVPPSSSENVGIFIPHENLWLEDEVKLKEYPSLEDAEEVEFKDKNAAPPPAPQEEGGGGCSCIIL